MWKNVVDYIGCDAEYGEADVVLFVAPFDSTTSFRPGTRFAGQAIRNDSYGLETYSPYQDMELTEGTVYDCGDLDHFPLEKLHLSDVSLRHTVYMGYLKDHYQIPAVRNFISFIKKEGTRLDT